MYFALTVFVLVFIFLGYHLYHVQITRHDELLHKAQKKYTTSKTTRGARGEIFDYTGELLAGNMPYGIITADPSIIDPGFGTEKVAKLLAKELDLPEDQVCKELSRKTREITRKGVKKTVPRRFLLLKTLIPYREFTEKKNNIIKGMKAIRKEWIAIQRKLPGDRRKNLQIRGIFFDVKYTRYYPKNQLLSNILGFSNVSHDEIVPMEGLEKARANDMDPEEGRLTYERRKDGIPLTGSVRKKIDEHDGADIFLTIREPLQAIVEEELENLMREWKPKAAYAVMINPHTGAILAIAQRPTFDPNDRKKMDPRAWRNRLVEDIYEPGSVMKPFAIAGALDRGIVTPETKVDCANGLWYYMKRRLRDTHKMGISSVTDIIVESSNIGTAKIALMMGKETLYETLAAFGYGQRTQLGLPRETRGIFHPVKRWSGLSVTRIPIGQGIAVSPIQLARAYCMLANGGHPIQLHLVDRIRNGENGKVVKLHYPVGKSIFRRSATGREILEILKKVPAPGGTASRAAVRGYHVAGKTGTAQKTEGRGYSERKYMASFVGFVPAEKPEFVLLVTADEPPGKRNEGGWVAAPAFGKIAERSLKYLQVPPDMPLAEYDKRWAALKKAHLEKRKKIWAEERRQRELRKQRQQKR